MFFRKRNKDKDVEDTAEFNPELKFQHVAMFPDGSAIIIHSFITDKYHNKDIDNKIFDKTPHGLILSTKWIKAVIDNMKKSPDPRWMKHAKVYESLLKENKITVRIFIYKTTPHDKYVLKKNFGESIKLISKVDLFQLGYVEIDERRRNMIIGNGPNKFFPIEYILDY